SVTTPRVPSTVAHLRRADVLAGETPARAVGDLARPSKGEHEPSPSNTGIALRACDTPSRPRSKHITGVHQQAACRTSSQDGARSRPSPQPRRVEDDAIPGQAAVAAPPTGPGRSSGVATRAGHIRGAVNVSR